MFIDKNGDIYQGDMQLGDREATEEEIKIHNTVRQNSFNIQEAKAYLASTEWYVSRLNDPSSGKAIPQEVLDKRAAARVLINELEAE